MSAEFSQEWRQMDLGGGGAIRYLLAGAGEPMILLHGLSGSVGWWQRNIPALARSYRVYAIDLLPQSSGSESRFVLAQAAERLAVWMDAIGLSKVALIGHSMGGYIAAQLAATHPDRVSKLVLVNAAIFPQTDVRLATARLLRSLPNFPPTLAPLLLRDALRAGPLLLWEASRDLLTSDLRPELERITARTLIVWGDRDGILPVEIAGELHAALPNSELHILPGIGHNSMWEAADAFNELVLAFLQRGERHAEGT